jgi:hypothetical protein
MSKIEKQIEVGQRYKDNDGRGACERIGIVDELRGEKAGITWLHNGRRTWVALHRLRSSDYSLLPEKPGSRMDSSEERPEMYFDPPLWIPDASGDGS